MVDIQKYLSPEDSIGIDNRCSTTISHRIHDFVGHLNHSNKKIYGYGGINTGTLKVGTIKWEWLDDKGIQHSFNIPNSYYAPQGRMRLLSPQHWAKEYKNIHNKSASVITFHDKVIMKWHDNLHCKTIPLGKYDNVVTIYMSPDIKTFTTFITRYESIYKDKNMCLPAYIDDDEVKKDLPHLIQLDELLKTNESSKQDKTNEIITQTTIELLNVHHKYTHVSMKRLQYMAKLKMINPALATCKIPVCCACLFNKSTKKPWKYQYANIRHIKG